MSSQKNTDDLRGRGTAFWWGRPECLRLRWVADKPSDPVTTINTESQAEYKIAREVIAAATVDWQPIELHQSLGRHDLLKPLRVCAWIARFIHKIPVKYCVNAGLVSMTQSAGETL